MTDKPFNPKSIINMQGLYRALINPDNKASRLDWKNIPKKHKAKINSLVYAIQNWHDSFPDIENIEKIIKECKKGKK